MKLGILALIPDCMLPLYKYKLSINKPAPFVDIDLDDNTSSDEYVEVPIRDDNASGLSTSSTESVCIINYNKPKEPML